MGIGKGSGRGGSRANSGRKAADGAEIAACMSISVDEATRAIIEELGEGNDSLGVRRMAAELLTYRSGGQAKRTTVQAATELQPIAKRRGSLRTPSKYDEPLPFDRNAVYD